MVCRVCGNIKDNKPFRIREMMYGSGDEFTYFECSFCGCLQIAEIPSDMNRYYPADYYSFRKERSGNLAERILRRERDRYAIFKKGFIGKIISARYPNSLLNRLGDANIRVSSRILDVGCGTGSALASLRRLGFKYLTGLDPYIERDITDKGMTIFKKTIVELKNDEKFDLILLNHSFEHMSGQREALNKISRILSEDGLCLVRMPLKTEYIWNRYGRNWVQIDAPRHFFIHTKKSFAILTERQGLATRDVVFESTKLQFYGSEQCKNGIPLMADNSYAVNPGKSIFTAKEIDSFKESAKKLNKTGEGDEAAFYLSKRQGK
ncbi:MAG: class I SAM-dependent methyltransferase [Candidatus Omnitrophica bacterium]|nr:class I SAM-dependent methyltransferase [Candidatus Omnitrophota bacterium]